MMFLQSPMEVLTTMRTIARWEPFRGVTTLQDQINRLFNDAFERTGEQSNLSAWAPAVDIYETEQELVVKADLPDVDPKDLDIRVENNLLTIRGERKFEKKVSEEHRPPLCGGCMSLKLFSRARQLWCGPSKIRGTTWLGS